MGSDFLVCRRTVWKEGEVVRLARLRLNATRPPSLTMKCELPEKLTIARLTKRMLHMRGDKNGIYGT